MNKYQEMRLDTLNQPCFNTTLMGVLRGVMDYCGIPVSDAMIYGGTGHAFLMNIHRELCPSGPYCWNAGTLFERLHNFGIRFVDLGFFGPDSSPEQRGRVEAEIRSLLDQGVPCALLNLENQLIAGYTGDHFITLKPWPGHDFPPGTLTFGSWVEFGEAVHCSFYAFRKAGEVNEAAIIRDSLRDALDLYRTPEHVSSEPYAGGLNAYDLWIQAVRDGHGKSHGNWWNAMVWGECRARAAAWMDELGVRLGAEFRDLTDPLGANYRMIAKNLEVVSNRELGENKKAEILLRTREIESRQIELLEQLSARYSRYTQ
ncbi:MAG TPA: hypothetical protein PLV45_07800 [bacterium]|nr:hypothetical protein [bacterium]